MSMPEYQAIDPNTGLPAVPMPPMINQSAVAPGADNNANLMRQYLKLAQATGPVGMEERDIARQQVVADELRKTGMPQGLNPTGRVYTAANPLQFAAAGLDRYTGAAMQPELERRRALNQQKLIAALADAVNPKQPNVVNNQPAQEWGY